MNTTHMGTTHSPVPTVAAPGLMPGLIARYRHWTPRYTYYRARQALYERAHRDAPWLTPEAIRLLGSLLRPTDRGLEFGSGRSTVWLAGRVAALTSVEEDKQWHEAVTADLAERGLTNVDYILSQVQGPYELGGSSEYARVPLAFADQSLDFVLVDGAYRDFVVQSALPKIKPGGLLIIDNINWYLPSQSRAPQSRSAEVGPETELWAELAQELSHWRSIWTSSGVWDTAMWIKPWDVPGFGELRLCNVGS
jgi:predicted O-methyltransferase YrrM